MAIVAVVVVVAAAGYWWLNRPPARYKPGNSGLYPINVKGKYGFMDRSGKTVITPQFDGAFGFSEGLAHVRVGTKSGYINTKGVVVITPQFDDAMQFQYGRAAVKLCCGRWAQPKQGDRFGFIDKDGKYIGTPDFRWVGMFSGDLAPVVTADGAVAFVNRSGKIAISGKVADVRFTGFTAGLAPAATGGKWGFIDSTGKWVVTPQFEGAMNFADGLAPVIVGGRTGYVDKEGKFVVNPQYDSGDEFYDGLASFASGGKSGFIDTKGRVVADAKFLGAGHFSDGLAPVKTEDGWGFIDRTGRMVVSPQFDTAEIFQDGLARVTVAGQEAYVTTRGAFVVDPFPRRAGIPVVHDLTLGQSERVRVRHILLQTVGKSPDEVKKIKAKAEDLLKQVKAGANFTELAKKYSEDPGSKDKGGEYGWMTRGQTVKNFETAAFSLQPGQTSDIVTTEYGFHIIQVEEKEPANEDAVRRGILNYLSKRPDLTAMDVTVTKVAFRQNEADATVHFQAKNATTPGTGLDVSYVLERKGNEWVVKGRGQGR